VNSFIKFYLVYPISNPELEMGIIRLFNGHGLG